MENSLAVGTGLKYGAVGTGLTLLPRCHGGEVVPTAETVPTVAVGTDLPAPMVFLCRRLTCWPGRNGSRANGPDILPSAQDLTVGTSARSRGVASPIDRSFRFSNHSNSDESASFSLVKLITTERMVHV
jgi:hypothetical protein